MRNHPCAPDGTGVVFYLLKKRQNCPLDISFLFDGPVRGRSLCHTDGAYRSRRPVCVGGKELDPREAVPQGIEDGILVPGLTGDDIDGIGGFEGFGNGRP